MKKLLVVLLALSMVLSMALTFAACGGDENADSSSTAPADSSKTESKTESKDEAASSDEAPADSSDDVVSNDGSSEDVSEDGSSEDGSSEDISEDGSSEESVEDPSSEETSNIEYITTPTKTNYALNKTYTVSKNGLEMTAESYVGNPSAEFADFDLKKLTDGVSAAGSDFNELGGAPNISVSYAGTGAMFEYIIDLGDYYGDIKAVTFRGVRDGYDNGNNRGFNETLMMAYVGDSIGSWSSRLATSFEATPISGAPEIGTQADPDVKKVENFDYTFTFSEVQQGRYVKVIACSEVYVLQFDEIEIWN